MGRKIPGKKHHGVKDPYKQQAERFATIKKKINNAPSDPNDQPVPKSLIRLMSWKSTDKSSISNKRTKIKNYVQMHGKQNENKIKRIGNVAVHNDSNPLKKIQRIQGESNKSFNMRINEALKTLKRETSFKDIEKDTLKQNAKTFKNEEKTENKKIKRKKTKMQEPQLTKSQKQSMKEKDRKIQQLENKRFDEMCMVKKDHFKFGEVVHEPPSLKIKPRKAELVKGAPRPARKDLLLNALFENKNETTCMKKSEDKITIDLKGKRKHLPQRIRKNLEDNRQQAIEAYRLLKLKSVKNSS